MAKVPYDPARWNQQAVHFEAELRELATTHTEGDDPTPYHVIATVALTLAAWAATRCVQWDCRFFRITAAAAWRAANDAISHEWAQALPRCAMFPKPHADLTDDEIMAEQRSFLPELQSMMRRTRQRVHDETVTYEMLRVALLESVRLGANPLKMYFEIGEIVALAQQRNNPLPFAEHDLDADDFTDDDAVPATERNS